MKRSQYTDQQIIGFLKQAEAGMPVKDLCRKEGFSDVTFYKRRAKFGGMDTSDAKRLRELEAENERQAQEAACRSALGHFRFEWGIRCRKQPLELTRFDSSHEAFSDWPRRHQRSFFLIPQQVRLRRALGTYEAYSQFSRSHWRCISFGTRSL